MEKIITSVINTVNKNSKPGQVFVVGGLIRDRLLRRDTKDLDFAVTINAKVFAKRISKLIKGSFIVLDEKNKIYRVVLKSKDGKECYNIDFSKIRGSNINDDLALRDFTVNAMAVKAGLVVNFIFKVSDVIDPFGGIPDIKKKLIRGVSKKIFKDDSLRLLRAYRLKAELNFDIDKDTTKLIKKNARRIKKSAGERIREEIVKILSSEDSAGIINEIDKQGILEYIIPEIKKMKKSARKYYYHPEGLWQHAKESMSAIEYILNNLNKYAGTCTAEVEKHLLNKKGLLKFVTLLHDVGKPPTAKVIEGRTRFFGHEETGKNMVNKIMNRLRMSRKETQSAERLVKYHMRPTNLSKAPKLTERAVYRFLRDIDDVSVELLLLSLADISSYLPPFSSRKRGNASQKDIRYHKDFVCKMIEKYFEYIAVNSQKRLVNGNIVMRKLSLPAGPLVGRIIRFANENQALGKIRTTEEALKLIKNNIPRLKRESLTYK